MDPVSTAMWSMVWQFVLLPCGHTVIVTYRLLNPPLPPKPSTLSAATLSGAMVRVSAPEPPPPGAD